MNRFQVIKGEFVPPFIHIVKHSNHLRARPHVSKQASKHRIPYQASKRLDLKHGACLLTDITVYSTVFTYCADLKEGSNSFPLKEHPPINALAGSATLVQPLRIRHSVKWR